MKQYDVVIEFFSSQHREIFTVDANMQKEAEQKALQSAIKELSVVKIEEVDDE